MKSDRQLTGRSEVLKLINITPCKNSYQKVVRPFSWQFSLVRLALISKYERRLVNVTSQYCFATSQVRYKAPWTMFSRINDSN